MATDTRNRFATLADAASRLSRALAEAGNHIAKTKEHLTESLKTIQEYLKDVDDVENGEGEPIYHTIAGATMGDTRVWMEEHGCDIESGEDVNHRDSPCIYVNLSETN